MSLSTKSKQQHTKNGESKSNRNEIIKIKKQGDDDETTATTEMECETTKDGDDDGNETAAARQPQDDENDDQEEGEVDEQPHAAENGSTSTDITIRNNNADMEMATKEKNIGSTATTVSANGAMNLGASADIADTELRVKQQKVKSTKKLKKTGTDKSATSASTTIATAAISSTASAPTPVMKGTLSYDLDQRRHLIRGMWNYEQSSVFEPQRFELLRNLGPSEDPKELPKDGEFHGSFSLVYVHTTSKGEQKEKKKVIQERSVKIIFTPETTGDNSTGKSYKVNGTGTNQFGIFHVYGTATPSIVEGDPTLNVVLCKRYDPVETPVNGAASSVTTATTLKSSKVKSVASGKASNTATSNVAAIVPAVGEVDSGPLPSPSESFPSGVVCLRGKLYKEESNELGLSDVIHRISGMWSSAGLDVLISDPENLQGLCNGFEYEHKSSVPSNAFPVTGRYSGWFDLSNDDGTITRINERDVTLKFRKNNAEYYNVEGKGSNVFGKYSITGTLTADNVITIFRHFQPRKLKSKAASSSAAVVSDASAAFGPTIVPSGAVTTPSLQRFPSTQVTIEPKLKLDDVELPIDVENGKPAEPMQPPQNTTYSAVSRGVLRLNDDNSHSCNGKWAVTREHFTNGQTSNFVFRLEAHHAAEAMSSMTNVTDEKQFPLDSAMYKGSFQFKKQGSRSQTIVDHQVVMKFRLNSQGSYNVYGRGVNAIGIFNLLGTMVMSGKTAGQVELYRMYPSELLNSSSAPTVTTLPNVATTQATTDELASTASVPVPVPLSVTASTAAISQVVNSSVHQMQSVFSPLSAAPPLPPPSTAQQRRESSRLVKLPSKLEDDDPIAQVTRVMQKCSQILQFIREKDVELGAFFSEPVDPVALGIPTYHQVIKEPIDLRTIHRRMEHSEIKTPEEFSRLVRLVFENAMTFNVDPAHSVHQAARSLLVMFNQKYRDVERMLPTLRRVSDGDDKGKKKGKDDKKRKRPFDEQRSLKRIRLEEAQAMATANASAVAAIVAAAPTINAATVTRAEFNMLLNLIQQLQTQLVETYTAVAELSPGDELSEEVSKVATIATTPTPSAVVAAPLAPVTAPERKKPVKRKSLPEANLEEPAAFIDDSRPLTLEEQEQLTETINDLPSEHLGGVIQIIREAAPVGADEDEIDLEIDQLDTKTQRKLLRHVLKFVKKTKTKVKKKTKATPAVTKKSELSSPSTKKAAASKAASKPKPATDSFFVFGDKADSDSDSDDDTKAVSTPAAQQQKPVGGKTFGVEASKEFKLSGGIGDDLDDHDDDEDGSLDHGGLAANWIMPEPVSQSTDADGDDDDAWGAAREHAAAAKAREAERKAREEKLKAEAEQLKNERLKAIAARGEEIRAQQLEEEEKEARNREKQEKEAEEARKAAREAARAQVQSVEQTVDLDAQRDIMKQYEQSFLDKDLGSASPSSDFGF